MEAECPITASEVDDWLRRVAGKRDHRQVMPDDDYLVLRPGPNFDWLMGNPTAGQPPPLALEQDLAGAVRRGSSYGRETPIQSEHPTDSR